MVKYNTGLLKNMAEETGPGLADPIVSMGPKKYRWVKKVNSRTRQWILPLKLWQVLKKPKFFGLNWEVGTDKIIIMPVKSGDDLVTPAHPITYTWVKELNPKTRQWVLPTQLWFSLGKPDYFKITWEVGSDKIIMSPVEHGEDVYETQ